MSAKTEIRIIANTCPASFFRGSIIRISSLIPTKKTISIPEIIYFSSYLKNVPARITVDNKSPMNTAIPPSVGIDPVCDVRPFGTTQRFFNFDIFTIDGMVNQVMPNAVKNPRLTNIQAGTAKTDMLKGKFTIN